MIEVRALSLQRNGRWLFHDAEFTVFPGWRVGLTGSNGSGKSSLLALIGGLLEPDSGHVHLPQSLRTVAMSQHTPHGSDAALDFVIDGDSELRRLQRQLEDADASGEGVRQGEIHARIEAIDGYAAPSRAAIILAGLGFLEQDLQRPLDSFSGGWRVRIALARVLMSRADLLLLDEPTNHLDLDAVLWLGRWLSEYRGSLLMVSHDRELLDDACTHILHIRHQRIRLWRGNYSEFERQRVAELEQQIVTNRKQLRERERLQRFVTRFRAKASKARQAQSRLKALERMEETAVIHDDSPLRFTLPEAGRIADPLLSLQEVSFGYDRSIVLEGVNLIIRPGTRLGLLGRNGAGKSTLMQLLSGELGVHTGQRLEGKGLRIGYFAQSQLQQLDPERHGVAHVRALSADVGEARVRDFLGGFGFSGDQALEPVAQYSGGERARLALALVAWRAPNLLLLDEPTNHLDMETRNALTLALQDYSGAMVLVSHDRHLLRACCDSLALLHNQRLNPFDGDLGDYQRWFDELRRGAAAPAPVTERPGRRQQRQQDAHKRHRLAEQRRPLKKRLADLENRIRALTDERASLDRHLADPAAYGNDRSDELKEIVKRSGVISHDLEQLETEWLQASMALDAIGES